MDWKKIKDQMPPLHKKILVWRHKSKKYSVVKGLPIPDKVPDWSFKRMFYHQEYGGSLAIEPDDLWLQFPPVSIPNIYD